MVGGVGPVEVVVGLGVVVGMVVGELGLLFTVEVEVDFDLPFGLWIEVLMINVLGINHF